QDEIAEALYSNDENHEAHTSVYNAMAWYAGEKASHEYANAMDELERGATLDTSFDTLSDLINSGHEIEDSKIEILKNLDNYLEQNDLSASIQIGDTKLDYGDITIEITNMKKIDGEFQDDVTITIDDKYVNIENEADSIWKLSEAKDDFIGIKHSLDKELGNEITITNLGENNHLSQVTIYETKANESHIDSAIESFVQDNGNAEKAIDINGERVAWQSGKDLVVDFSGEAGSNHERLAEAVSNKADDLGINVLSANDGFSSKIDAIQNDKQEVKQESKGMELD
ncbi:MULTISPECIES: hypothetical protein, partial [unclassified Acinetobacter]|uniref:hypothetical protein n=1 Tax=unclassified Acinetobacter TaxID=196816 RepID=UPI0015D3C643